MPRPSPKPVFPSIRNGTAAVVGFFGQTRNGLTRCVTGDCIRCPVLSQKRDAEYPWRKLAGPFGQAATSPAQRRRICRLAWIITAVASLDLAKGHRVQGYPVIEKCESASTVTNPILDLLCWGLINGFFSSTQAIRVASTLRSLPTI
jgi:hypothetical protein